MRRNGFTLIELLGVVIILSMLGIVIVPTINKVIADNKQELYDVQIRNIKSGASNFVSENIFELDIPNNGSIGIKLGKLKEMGYIEDNVVNPFTRDIFSDDLIILITNSNSSYNYTVCDGSVNCDTNVVLYGE